MFICRRNVKAEGEVKLCGEKIQKIDSIKYLGVVVDKRLTLNENVLFVVKEVAKKITCFGRIAKNLTFAAKIMVYNSIIAPHFDYCATLLYSSKLEYIKKLQIIQNRALRIILKCSRYTETSLMLETLKFISVKQRIRSGTLKMVYKIKHGVPQYLSTLTTYNKDIQTCDDFRLPYFKKSNTQRMMLYKGLSD